MKLRRADLQYTDAEIRAALAELVEMGELKAIYREGQIMYAHPGWTLGGEVRFEATQS